MPGLTKEPSAIKMDIDNNGKNQEANFGPPGSLANYRVTVLFSPLIE
nr:hypothetical protein [Sporomusa sp. KB1]